MSVVDFFDLTGVLFYLRMSRSFLKLNPFMGRQPVIDNRLADRSKVNDAGFDVPDRQSKTLICPCSIQAHIIYHRPPAGPRYHSQVHFTKWRRITIKRPHIAIGSWRPLIPQSQPARTLSWAEDGRL